MAGEFMKGSHVRADREPLPNNGKSFENGGVIADGGFAVCQIVKPMNEFGRFTMIHFEKRQPAGGDEG